MRTNRNIFAIAVGLVVCLTLVWFCTSIQGSPKSYEVRPEITLPELRTDTARAIDAYERLMDRFMSLTERNLICINTEVKDIAQKLCSIDRKLTELSVRMAGIEQALGIERPKPPAKKRLSSRNNPAQEGVRSLHHTP